MSTPQTLREYQRDCIIKIKMAWATPNSEGRYPRVPNDLATGSGKTTILSQLLREMLNPLTQRALVIAHTEEIIQQLHDRIKNQFAELESWYHIGGTLVPGIGIVMNTLNAYNARIVVATRQSLTEKRMQQILGAGVFDYLIVDEAHHDVAGTTYNQLEKQLFEVNPALKKAGFSATWNRTDKKALASGYDEIPGSHKPFAFQWTILDGINHGNLVPPSCLRVMSNVDLSGLNSVGGDYNQKQLASMLHAANWVDLAIDATKTYLLPTRKHIMAFFHNVEASKMFVSHIQQHGVNAAHVDGTTDRQVRRDIRKAYSRGEITIVSNYGVFTEGFDEPITDGILWARPTRSATVVTQAIGRGLRPTFGKTDCLVLDIAARDTKAAPAGTLAGKMKRCKECGVEFFFGFPSCPACGWLVASDKEENLLPDENGTQLFFFGGRKRMMEGLHATEVSLFDAAHAAWYRRDEHLSVGCGRDNGTLVIAPPTWQDIERQRERLLKAESLLLSADETLKSKLIMNVQILQREIERSENYTLYYVPSIVSDEYKKPLPRHLQKSIEYLRANSDLASLIAEADIEAMRRGGKYVNKNSDFHGGNSLATESQVNYLKRLGIKDLPDPLFKGVASQILAHKLAVPRVERFIESDFLPEKKTA